MTAQSGRRRRFWIEAAAALGSGLLAVITFIWPDWIERIFGIEPDQGSGALEWLVVAVVFAISDWLRPCGAARVASGCRAEAG